MSVGAQVMNSPKSPERSASGYKFLGGWIPEEHRSTIALVWRVDEARQTSFVAEVTRSGQAPKTIRAATLPALAQLLTETCGLARRSMVRLGIPLPGQSG